MSREVMTAFRAKAVTQRDLPREMLERATMGGIVALVATTLAILFANSALAPSYQALWQTELSITAGTLQLSRPLLAWINQGLLTLLFFVMGLELKRQWSAERATIHMLRLPLVAALGGAIVPATFYAGFNLHSLGLRGWTIPLATDAALALALVALLGTHIPVAVRFFFLTIALIRL